MLSSQKMMSAPSGGANYIDDVFSTYLYKGNGSSKSVYYPIDLETNGGMVWIKDRDAAINNRLFYRDDGFLASNLDGAEFYDPTNYPILRYTTAGFYLGSQSSTFGINTSGRNYVSWTFRKQEKFFDVVTYTGNGSTSQNIAHSLGSKPGCIIIKATSTTGDWWVTTRKDDSQWAYNLKLNTTGIASTWYPTSSDINASTFTTYITDAGSDTNSNGVTYVAYLFAHNAGGFGASGTDNVISCGSFTTDSNGNNSGVNLGYEPQWILIKDSTNVDDWYIYDSMRGMTVNEGNRVLYADLSAAEGSYTTVKPSATGFYINNNGLAGNATYIYIAIRRPHKPPTTGTEVFKPYAYAGDGTASRDYSDIGMVTDMNWTSCRSNDVGVSPIASTRIQGNTARLQLNTGDAEATGTYGLTWNAYQNGYQGNSVYAGGDGWNGSSKTYVSWNFRRSPGFFDIVCYAGDGTARSINHNLQTIPELVVVKERIGSQGAYGVVYQKFRTGTNKILSFSSNLGEYNDTNAFPNSSNFSDTTFSVGTSDSVNNSYSSYIAYLFATLDGVSKVGSYTGTGTTQQIDCGFSGGARFVMIKRTDSTGDWYVWDSARGIVSGNDPYLRLNSTAAETTSTDYIDPYSAGFEISSTAPAAINASGGSFIYLAIA